MSEPVVIVARLHGADLVPVEFFNSWASMQKPAGWIDYNIVRMPTHHARNTVVNLMLRTHDGEFGLKDAGDKYDRVKEATHIFYMDDDMTFPHDALLRLLADDVPIVSGMYVKRFEPFWPVPMRRVSRKGYTSILDYCPGLQEVDVVGGGCLLVRRDVLEAIPYPWFDYVPPQYRGKQITEDVPFCEAVRKAGFPLLLDFDVQCGHLARGRAEYANWLDYKDGLDMKPTDPEQKKIMRAALSVRPWKKPEPAVAPAEHTAQEEEEVA